jgi:internalin A
MAQPKFEPSIAETRISQAYRSRVTELDLSGLELAKLPESLGQLSDLRKLHLDGNRLTALPDFFSKLSRLQYLNLSDNKLSVPQEFWPASRPIDVVRTINLHQDLIKPTQSSEKARSWLDTLAQLVELQTLDLHANDLTKLPDNLGQLSELRRLDVHSNKLTGLPPTVGALRKLEDFDCHDNKLTRLPENFGELYNLRRLDIHGNRLTSLPITLGGLDRLEELFAQDNALSSLPSSLCDLKNLRTLYLQNNQLSSFPAHHSGFLRLYCLNLSNNSLTALPSHLKSASTLKLLFMHNNLVFGLPDHVLGPTWEQVFIEGEIPANPADVFEYYVRVQRSQRPLNEAKLILVGRGGVGKTSIVDRLLNGGFSKEQKKTEGINIRQWNVLISSNETVQLNVWDFGGQEIMDATHRFFLTERSIYLVILNGRGGNESGEVEYWLKLIESFGPESPVIVVLNKINEHSFDLNRRGLRQKYSSVRVFVRTDCEDGTGIDALLAAIKREVDSLEHLRDAFPASWFAIRDRLAGMEENYISFDEYREICANHGEPDPIAQKLLASYLHSLGIALNYRDDPRLRYTYVLNPRWVTNGIYSILNARKLEAQKGEMDVQDLCEILDQSTYPHNMVIFLLDLMKKFEMCFVIQDSSHRIMIPELLDIEEPDVSHDFQPETCLNFEYHYPVLPEGILPRFIVRTSSLSENCPRWRTGVVLEFEKNRALIKADMQEKKVFIRVNGILEGRRRLLAVIRSDFERIHADIKTLKPSEYVPVPFRPHHVVPYRKLIILEEKQQTTFDEVFDDDIISLNVASLLNGVDMEGTRLSSRSPSAEGLPLRVFYSYSHKDERLRNRLDVYLKLLQRRGLISSWFDRRITAGDEWKQSIDENLNNSDIILLMISADFIASDYCYEHEMSRALERHSSGEAIVVPVILRDVDWSTTPFARLNVLPKDGVAVMKWQKRDSAWRHVSEAIEQLVYEIREKRKYRTTT